MTGQSFRVVLLALLVLSEVTYLHAVEFTFNGFNSSTNLLLYGNSTLESNDVISLTEQARFSLGRILYPSKIPTRSKNMQSGIIPFSTSFIFSIAQVKNTYPGHGLVFLFAPDLGIHGVSSAQHLGLFNRTNDGDINNHVFGIEFDVFKNPEFEDIDENHVGVNINSLTSIVAQPAGYWIEGKDGTFVFNELKLNNGVNYQVWVDYGANAQLNVTMVHAGITRPKKPLISTFVDLSNVLLDEMYVGFCAATGTLVERHRILAWSFSTNLQGEFSLSTSGLPSFVPKAIVKSTGFIVGITVSSIVFIFACVGVYICLAKRSRRRAWEKEAAEEWEL